LGRSTRARVFVIGANPALALRPDYTKDISVAADFSQPLSRLRRCTQGIVALATIGYGGIIITENMDPMIIGTFFKEIGV
jgi:hypothetical protein